MKCLGQAPAEAPGASLDFYGNSLRMLNTPTWPSPKAQKYKVLLIWLPFEALFINLIRQTCGNMVGEELDEEEAFSCVVNTSKKITLSLSMGPAVWEGHCTTPHYQSSLWLFSWIEALCPKENWLWKQLVRPKQIILVNRVVLFFVFWGNCIHSDCFS